MVTTAILAARIIEISIQDKLLRFLHDFTSLSMFHLDPTVFSTFSRLQHSTLSLSSHAVA